MGYAHEIIEDYFRRAGHPGDSAMDAVWQLERTLLRDMLTRLEIILGDEGVDHATAARVIRCMLYGSPSPAAAEMRMRETERTVEMLQRIPPMPIEIIGLEPKRPR